jgi:hypothetical protein
MRPDDVELLIKFASCKKNARKQPEFGVWASQIFDKARRKQDRMPSTSPSAADLQLYFDGNQPMLVARQMFALEALAAAVWPVIEAVIILDRALFLVEGGAGIGNEEGGPVTVRLEPLFNPADSPRNFCLIACRGEGRPAAGADV